jgi:hypothetical protein
MPLWGGRSRRIISQTGSQRLDESRVLAADLVDALRTTCLHTPAAVTAAESASK